MPSRKRCSGRDLARRARPRLASREDESERENVSDNEDVSEAVSEREDVSESEDEREDEDEHEDEDADERLRDGRASTPSPPPPSLLAMLGEDTRSGFEAEDEDEANEDSDAIEATLLAE